MRTSSPGSALLNKLTRFIVTQKFYDGCVICIEISAHFCVCIVMAYRNFLIGTVRPFLLTMNQRVKPSHACSGDVHRVKPTSGYGVSLSGGMQKLSNLSPQYRTYGYLSSEGAITV